MKMKELGHQKWKEGSELGPVACAETGDATQHGRHIFLSDISMLQAGDRL